MRKTIFSRYLLLILVAVLVCGGVTLAITSQSSSKDQQEKMLGMLRVMELYYEDSDSSQIAKRLSESAEGARITLIAPDGTVLDDSVSDPAHMKNHLERKEIANAIALGQGMEIRKSETLGSRQMYVAYRLNDGIILRMSLNTTAIENYAYELFPAIIVAMIAAFIASALIVSKLVERIITPLDSVKSAMLALREGDYSKDVPASDFDELNDIISVFNSLAANIRASAQSLEIEKSKVDFILQSMEEGLVLVDGSLDIIHANQASKRFFSCDFDVEGKNILYLVHNSRVNEAVENAVKKQVSRLFDIPDFADSDTILQVHVTPLQSEFLGKGERASGAIMVITDVTTQRSAQQMRQDFFSNCSHELKTPITSIQGFAEILQSQIADEQRRDEYIGRILSEAKRMAALIEDILKISRLESGSEAREIIKLPISLLPLCQEICQNLHPQAAQAEITLNVEGDDCIILADKNHMHELCLNLIENAVKYNRKGGNVTVTLTNNTQSRKINIEVKDTGIGIALAHQNRIFERFYRADKGRSTKLGSTGLGLSIVKHIVGVYGGEISLLSREDVGTTIRVTLPM